MALYERFFMPLENEADGYGFKGREPAGRCIIENRGGAAKISLWAQDIRPQIKYNTILIFETNEKKFSGVTVANFFADEKGKAEIRKDIENIFEFSLAEVVAVAVAVENSAAIIAPLCGYRDKKVSWKKDFSRAVRAVRAVPAPVFEEVSSEIMRRHENEKNSSRAVPAPNVEEVSTKITQRHENEKNSSGDEEIISSNENNSSHDEKIIPSNENNSSSDEKIISSEENNFPRDEKIIPSEENNFAHDEKIISSEENNFARDEKIISSEENNSARDEKIIPDGEKIHTEAQNASKNKPPRAKKPKPTKRQMQPSSEILPAIEQIFATKQHFQPFADMNDGNNFASSADKNHETVWTRLTISDAVPLPENSPRLLEEPFVRAAYANFEHLILGLAADKSHYILGVPCEFSAEFRLTAKRLGFSKFKTPANEPPKRGESGYWLMFVEL